MEVPRNKNVNTELMKAQADYNRGGRVANETHQGVQSHKNSTRLQRVDFNKYYKTHTAYNTGLKNSAERSMPNFVQFQHQTGFGFNASNKTGLTNCDTAHVLGEQTNT